jgi:hypothetical protein
VASFCELYFGGGENNLLEPISIVEFSLFSGVSLQAMKKVAKT